MDLAAEWHALLSAEEVSPSACLRFAASLLRPRLVPLVREKMTERRQQERAKTSTFAIRAANRNRFPSGKNIG